ncbi:hypothetical protein RND71_035097 [Anisodus tanguticus]|uniref:Uncharacterized protein n=1 Tax=Anisodus tanguticus TaxID=243964 RepID=A0AAE1UZG7_9SOLA|nr:hypothetical protein RND71_035097 [Anisodus tanguticus]
MTHSLSHIQGSKRKQLQPSRGIWVIFDGLRFPLVGFIVCNLHKFLFRRNISVQ